MSETNFKVFFEVLYGTGRKSIFDHRTFNGLGNFFGRRQFRSEGNDLILVVEVPMKSEIVFTPPKWSFEANNNAHEILNQKRGQNRRMTYPLIVIETLRAISGRPTKDQLQKLCKIRRARFLPVLRHLIEIESVKRSGTGSKLDPFVYELGQKELRR